jgi:lysophospholipase L1-like esterase
VPVHLLVSSSSWHCGLLAAISLEAVSKKNWRFVFHDDGSVTDEQRLQILKSLPGVRFVSRQEAEEKMAILLSNFPLCRQHRARHNFFLKIFDIPLFAESSHFILLDSDVLFFREPLEVVKWVESSKEAILFNEDTQEKYCNPRQEIETKIGLNLLHNFNSGLVLMRTKAIDLSLAESFLSKFEGCAHHPQFFEQTLYCLMASKDGKGSPLPRKYEISWGYLRNRIAVCRHYVGAFKHDLLYIEGGTFLFFRLLPSMFSAVIKQKRGYVLIALILAMVTCAGVFAAAKLDPQVEAFFFRNAPFEAVQSRSGLPKSLAKLQSGSDFTIGFLGGSITQNAEPEGFVSSLRDHLISRFPNSKIKTINAGMASTDSAWGAKRIERDLLVYRPDLIFVEFAVNDGERDSARDMERIVRKIHEANPATEVVFIYSTSQSAFKKLSKRISPKSIEEHEKVARHYRIPSVILGNDLFKKIRTGEWGWSDFSHDSCHPTIKGYESYSRDLLAAVDEFFEKKPPTPSDFPTPIQAGFELRPPKRFGTPITAVGTMTDSSGQKSTLTERMPVPGREWLEKNRFNQSSGSEWRLEYAVFSSVPHEDDSTAKNAKWLPARWFEEGVGFSGERSRLIAEPGSKTGSKLWMTPYLVGGSVEVPQIIWTPRGHGNCLFEISATEIQGHVNGPPASAGFEILLSRANGQVQKIGSVVAHEGAALRFRQAIIFEKGDSLVVRPFAKGYEFLHYDGVEILAGFFEKPPAP